MPYPASASTVTGTDTALATRSAAANISCHGAPSPSGWPSIAAMALLAVATAGNPASATTVALAASHTFGSTSISPPCSSLSRTA
jgi:hypothetical protein